MFKPPPPLVCDTIYRIYALVVSQHQLNCPLFLHRRCSKNFLGIRYFRIAVSRDLKLLVCCLLFPLPKIGLLGISLMEISNLNRCVIQGPGELTPPPPPCENCKKLLEDTKRSQGRDTVKNNLLYFTSNLMALMANFFSPIDVTYHALIPRGSVISFCSRECA